MVQISLLKSKSKSFILHRLSVDHKLMNSSSIKISSNLKHKHNFSKAVKTPLEPGYSNLEETMSEWLSMQK